MASSRQTLTMAIGFLADGNWFLLMAVAVDVEPFGANVPSEGGSLDAVYKFSPRHHVDVSSPKMSVSGHGVCSRISRRMWDSANVLSHLQSQMVVGDIG